MRGNFRVTNTGGATITYDDNTQNIVDIETDTADMQPKLGTPAGASISADIATVDANVDAVLADTNELQTDWADGGRLDLILDARASQTTADAIETDTQDIQSRLPAALVGGRMDSDVEAINNDTTAADRLALHANTVQPATVDNTGFTPTTTIFECDDITEATADHYIGRSIVFTSGALQYQATEVTDYALNGGRGRFTVATLTEAPANNDTLLIV